MCFKKNKIIKPKYGLTKDKIRQEIDHYHKWLPQAVTQSEKEQIQFMLDKYQGWLDNFDVLDTNHDGALQESEVK